MLEIIRIFLECEVRIENPSEGHCLASQKLCRVMPKSDPEVRIILSAPNNHDRFFFLHII